MSPSELDLPILASPDQIRRREFVTTRRGYDPGQVREYLRQIADQVEKLETMAREARLQAEAAVRSQEQTPPADPYEQLGQRVADLIRAAEAQAEQIRREARDEAEQIAREARAEADRVRLDAQGKAEEAREQAERALREARERADRTLAGLTTRRDALVAQLAGMQERLLGVARELEAAIDRDESHPVVIEDAPAVDRSDEPAADRADEPRAQAPARSRAGGAAETAGTGGPSDARGFEELWSDQDADPDLAIPDIPPLDLGWDAEERDG
ncbi:MAG: DivIVA domain-containing protein [Candidatus Velamenicoccus archaeovorus]